MAVIYMANKDSVLNIALASESETCCKGSPQGIVFGNPLRVYQLTEQRSWHISAQTSGNTQQLRETTAIASSSLALASAQASLFYPALPSRVQRSPFADVQSNTLMA